MFYKIEVRPAPGGDYFQIYTETVEALTSQDAEARVQRRNPGCSVTLLRSWSESEDSTGFQVAGEAFEGATQILGAGIKFAYSKSRNNYKRVGKTLSASPREMSSRLHEKIIADVGFAQYQQYLSEIRLTESAAFTRALLGGLFGLDDSYLGYNLLFVLRLLLFLLLLVYPSALLFPVIVVWFWSLIVLRSKYRYRRDLLLSSRFSGGRSI